MKISLTKNINLESDDERQSPVHGGGQTGSSPVPRPGSGESMYDKMNPVY